MTPGDARNRPAADRAADLTHASFFSGVGGLDLGLERAGWRTVSFSEVDPYASAVLASRWPGVPNLGDIVDLDGRERERRGADTFAASATAGRASSMSTNAVIGAPPPSGPVDSRARISASPGSGPGSGQPQDAIGTLREHVRPGSEHETDVVGGQPTTPAADSPSPSLTLWSATDPDGSSWRTSLAFSPLIAVPISPRSCVAWATSGMAWRTGSSMHAITASLSEGDESSSWPRTRLADVLEPSAPPRFSLSPRAASGILRRAAKRGRELPPALSSALSSLAKGRASDTTTPMTTSSSVRRLTPTECERLMGWPDGHTIVPGWRRRAEPARRSRATRRARCRRRRVVAGRTTWPRRSLLRRGRHAGDDAGADHHRPRGPATPARPRFPSLPGDRERRGGERRRGDRAGAALRRGAGRMTRRTLLAALLAVVAIFAAGFIVGQASASRPAQQTVPGSLRPVTMSSRRPGIGGGSCEI